MTANYDAIEALHAQGLSFSEIGARLGISKDAARGLHVRGTARLSDPLDGRERPVAGPAPAAGTIPVPAPGRRDPGPAAGRGADVPAAPAYIGFDIGYFDLEASGLNGSFGRLFSAACAHADGAVWEARIDDHKYRNRKHPSDDFKLAVAIRDHLLAHDILVSWNGKRGWNSKGRSGFDVPMLNARLMVPGHERERVIGRYVKHIDLLKEVRKYIELHSFRLVSVQEFLELTEEKNSILPRLWGRALDGDREALDYICLHNRKDVLVLRLVFEEMRRAGLLERPTW
jgi:uncharacterized protein YprB with RNaseH-like and TPR domain